MFIYGRLLNSFPTVFDRNFAVLEARQTVEQRAQEIGSRLLLLLNRSMSPETLMFDVSQSTVDYRDR